MLLLLPIELSLPNNKVLMLNCVCVQGSFLYFLFGGGIGVKILTRGIVI